MPRRLAEPRVPDGGGSAGGCSGSVVSSSVVSGVALGS